MDIISSLFPDAILFPSGLQVMLIFSPEVGILAMIFPVFESQILTVLSALAVATLSLFVGSQQS